ncbi:MAG: PEP-CTERM sorting domain-containing protein, partial [Alphaproteobacteria bacterium]
MALGPGSIAIIGFNADGNDNLAFAVLETITAGQAIFFEDNEWNGTGWADANENALIWTATSDVAAGTVVRLDNLGAGTLAASIGTLASAPSATHGANRGLAASDETFYAYTGSRAAPVFLTAVSNDGSDAANGSLVGTG